MRELLIFYSEVLARQDAKAQNRPRDFCDYPAYRYLLPSLPRSHGIRLQPEVVPQLVELVVPDGGIQWAQGVLDNTLIATTKLQVPSPGAHLLHVGGLEAGVVLGKLVIDCGGLSPSYFGPAETTKSDR